MQPTTQIQDGNKTHKTMVFVTKDIKHVKQMIKVAIHFRRKKRAGYELEMA
jgi:energy-coupling factor transporter ATP-binding protein EcfA2